MYNFECIVIHGTKWGNMAIWQIRHSNEAQPLFSFYEKRPGNLQIKTKVIQRHLYCLWASIWLTSVHGADQDFMSVSDDTFIL